MYSKLALRNVRRQMGSYLIYFMTVALTVALLFAVNNVIFSAELAAYSSIFPELKTALMGIIIFISLIVAFVLSYATSFMLKLRKREFGTYLTLGMTRGNILTLFTSETMLICLIALGTGLALGLVIYQGLMAIVLYLLETDFAIAAYSPGGILFTIVLVVGIFILSSLTSALYLRRVSIYDLIHGEKKVEKSIKHPGIWLVITVVSLALMAAACFSFWEEMKAAMTKGTDAYGIFPPLFTFAVCVILFHMGIARSAVYLLLHRRGIRSRGTNTFVLRQLSGNLGSNSVMIGFLAFLLAFAVIGINISFDQKSTQEYTLNQMYPYDALYEKYKIPYGDTVEGQLSQEEAEEILEQYVTIKQKIPYTFYDSGGSDLYQHTRWFGEGYEMLTDSFMAESDFNALVTPLGYEPVELREEFVVVSNISEVNAIDWSGTEFSWAGVTYHYKDILTDYPCFGYIYFYTVVPDEAVETMEPYARGVAYDFGEERYEPDELEKALNYTVTETYMGEQVTEECNDFRFRERGRLEENSQNAILVIGALFAGSVFLFMAMAILALKTLSSLSGDKEKYQILFRLGAGEREQSKALFRQTFSFFLVPFVIPLFMGIPTAVICGNLVRLNGMNMGAFQFFSIAAAIALVMTLIYLLYYTATYLIAKRVVVRADI